MTENRIAILDVDSICYTIANPNKLLDSYGTPLKSDGKFVYEEKTKEQLLDSADFVMNKILTNCYCTHYIAFIKGKNTVTNKRLINPEYKANRPKESPKWWNFIKGYLIENWNVVEVNNLEVDDACNIVRLNLQDSFIVCIDSDLLMLEGKHFKWRSKNDLKGEWITTSKEQAEYKFWSDMICGTHNATKGIPNKGIAYFKNMHFENHLGLPMGLLVFREYLDYFGESKGIQEFYKNYMCNKILESYEGFQLPELSEFKRKEELSEEKGIFD